MGSKCTACGHDVDDLTQDCPGCGHRVREARQAQQLDIANEALAGWRRRVFVLAEINAELLDACRHAHKVLSTGDDHPSMLVTHLQEAIEKAEEGPK